VSGGTSRSHRGRDRDDGNRVQDGVPAENNPWFVDDDLPAVVEPADRTDPGSEGAGPHLGGSRRA
jgi:hypothetical protein